MGFVKASELMGNTISGVPDCQEASDDLSAPIAPQFATSFIPASKLVTSSAITEPDNSVRSVTCDAVNTVPDAAHVSSSNQRNSAESPSSLTGFDEHSCPSTSYGGAHQLKRLHIDPNDLYSEASSDEDLPPTPPVSGPGLGFQRASSLSISSALSQSASNDMTRIASSGKSAWRATVSGARGKRKQQATEHTTPLKIANYFER